MRKVSFQIPRVKSICILTSLIAGMLFSTSVRSQDFNYSFAKDSVAWQELNTQTILNGGNSAWNFSYKIPIGFPFNYLGRNFDSLKIETNGYLVFDDNRNYALTAFSGFGDCIDDFGNHSVLGYELSGTSGNRILKIQFKNAGSSSQTNKHFTYQIWLRENNALEVHIGQNDLQPGFVISNRTTWVESVLLDSVFLPNDSLLSAFHTDSLVLIPDTAFNNIDSMHVYYVGMLNMNMDTQTTSGLFIGGTLSSPQSQPVNSSNPEPIYFLCAPASGTRYIFTPNSN